MSLVVLQLMAKFVFKLDALLRARRAAERERQRAMAALQRERAAFESRLRRQQQMIEQGRADLRRELVGRLDTSSLRSHAASSMRLMRDAQRMAIELAHVHQRIEQARADLAKAAAARRAMELLREKRFDEWKRVQAKREASAMDDLAVAKAHGSRS